MVSTIFEPIGGARRKFAAALAVRPGIDDQRDRHRNPR